MIIILLMIPINAKADNNTDIEKTNNQKIQGLYDYISGLKSENDLLKDMDAKSYVDSFIKTGDGKLSSQKILNVILKEAFKEVLASLKLMIQLFIVAIICALLSNLEKAFSNERLSNIAYFACYSLILIILTKSFYIGITTAKDTIYQMTNFMSALMPVLMILLASVGGFTEAAVMDPIIIGVINIFSNIFVTVIIPIILMSFVVQFVNSLSDEHKVDKLAKLLSQIAIWAQGIIMTVFIGIITIRGITSNTIDQVTAKTAKYAVDNFVPLVGKCLSDAVTTVAGYSLLLKNALSSLGLIIILIIVLFPVIKILIMAFMYKLSAALIEPISDKRLVNCISAAGDSMILIMSSLICVSVMFFIMISIVAAAGKMAVGG